MNMTGWNLANAAAEVEVFSKNDMLMADLKNTSGVEGQTLYWKAPGDYLGNRVSPSLI